MSIFSKIFKGVKKIFKGVKKIVKKTFKRVAKVFKAVVKYGKKFLKSKLGKALMIGVAIYFGGAALGAWGSTGSAGALAGSTAGTTLGTTAATTAGTTAATTAGTTAAASALPGSVAAAAAAPVVELAAASALPGSIATAAAPGLVESAVSLGKAAGGWMTANPALTVAGAQGVQAALAPDPYEEALKAEEERRRRSNIAGIYGSGEGEAIGLGLLDRAQTADLYTPTYQRSVGG